MSGRRRRELAARIALIAGSVLFSLMLLELGCRLVLAGPEGLIHWTNLARERMRNSVDGSGDCAAAYDATLGWKTPARCVSRDYNSDADGFRITPATVSLAGSPILVTGSSFANGDEVTDMEAWPVYLQNLIGRRVVNAGVSGYSLDQTVLRTERLVPQVKPLLVIASFTPDDIRRSELKVAWSRQKPYFTVTDGKLELHNVPVPGRPHAPVPVPLAAQLLGWSVLADLLVDRLNIFEGWFYDEVRGAPAGMGPAATCRLMPELAKLGVPVVVLAQYSRGHWMADAEGKARDFAEVRPLLDCAARSGLIPFDMSGPLKPVVAARGIDALFRSDHHSAEGNRVVADLIMQKLVRRRLLPQSADRSQSN